MKKIYLSIITLFLLILLQDYAFAGVQEGIAAMGRGDYKTAYNEFLPLAEKGDDKAMITIGQFYHNGQGFPVDYKKAMQWYLKTLDKNNYNAMNNIGTLYLKGLGVKKNLVLAYALFDTASKNLRNEYDIARALKNLKKTDMIISSEELGRAKKIKREDLTADKLKTYKPAGFTINSFKSIPFKSLNNLKSDYIVDKEKNIKEFKNVDIAFVKENNYQEYTGFIGMKYQKQPDLKNKVIKEGLFFSEKGNFKIRVPKLSSGKIDIYQTSRRNGTDNEVKFFEKGIAPLVDWPINKNAWHAVALTTKLPIGWKGQGKKALDITEKMQKDHARALPDEIFQISRVKGQFGEAVQVIVLNRIPSKIYPQTDFYIYPLRNGLKTIGINRIFMVDNILVELGMIVAIPEKMKPDQAVNFAINQMNIFMSGFDIIKKTED